jgi:tetratricopeptide (TPR) repeat protein
LPRSIAFIARIIFALSLLGLGDTNLWAKTARKAKSPTTPSLRKPTADEIVRNFTFIGDFDTKDETRNNSKEIFWRYPSTLPKVNFELKLEQSPEALKVNFPVTQGEGRAVEHLNTGRNLFLEGEYEDARQTWLSGRARFGKNYPFHRRNDYFIASAFLYKSYKAWLANGRKWDVPDLRQDLVNSNSFLSAAFDKKKDIADELLDRIAPNAYYNQAVILYNYERWAGVVGAATLGLDFLRKTARTEYRRDFHRMLAETSIRGQDYLEAVRSIDLTLRQDHDPATAAALFARVGDIYFSLNNFELAEEVYEAANSIDSEHRQIKPSQFVLRGESLFWLGRFEEARKNLQYALNAQSSLRSDEVLDDDMQALASLRIADTYLAEKNLEKAKIAYFSHSQDFRGHPTENFAKLRLACLELPFYEGKNVLHARTLLAELKDQIDKIPKVAQEIAWTCETASFAQHERNADMVERVRKFAALYPDSELLRTLVEPLRDVQSQAIESYFQAHDDHGAVQFFEKTKDALYPKVPDELARKLFAAYVDIHESAKSEPFLKAYEGSALDDLGKLRLAVAYAELIGTAKIKKSPWPGKLKALSDKMVEDKVFFEKKSEVLLMTDRMKSSPGRSILTPWLLEQALRWTENDLSVGCDMVYPLLQAMVDAKSLTPRAAGAADAFIESHLKDLLRFETSCAYSLMEFEANHSNLKRSQLVERYLKRDYIVLDVHTAPIYWDLAEQAHAEGSREAARKVWQLLADKGDPKLPEVRFAKARLDTRKTELENLWDR